MFCSIESDLSDKASDSVPAEDGRHSSIVKAISTVVIMLGFGVYLLCIDLFLVYGLIPLLSVLKRWHPMGLQGCVLLSCHLSTFGTSAIVHLEDL